MKIAAFIVILLLSFVIPFTLLRGFSISFANWEDYGNFGTYLAGLAAIIGITTGLDEFIKRRKLSQLEKAEKALVVARRFIDAVLYLANPLAYGREGDEERTRVEKALNDRQERWKSIQEDAAEFFKISYEVDLYLDEETLKKFQRLETIWGDIRHGFNTYIMYLEQNYSGPEMTEAWSSAFGRGSKEELKVMNEFIVSKMRSYRKKT